MPWNETWNLVNGKGRRTSLGGIFRFFELAARDGCDGHFLDVAPTDWSALNDQHANHIGPLGNEVDLECEPLGTDILHCHRQCGCRCTTGDFAHVALADPRRPGWRSEAAWADCSAGRRVGRICWLPGRSGRHIPSVSPLSE